MKRLNKVSTSWSPGLAYAIGLIASDGNLSKDGRHMNLTSKDIEMIETFKKCLGLKNKTGRKARGGSKEKRYFFLQFGDKTFYEFLVGIGLSPAKSKTLGALKIENKYFADFLRGIFDGDGNINIFKHPESKHPQLRVRFFSASPNFISWIKVKNQELLGVGGFQRLGTRVIDLAYAKADSIKLLNFMYYKDCTFFLKRKHSKAVEFLEK